jgi:exopolysaccharide biosynthesis protein
MKANIFTGRMPGRMALRLLAILITLASSGLAIAQQTLADADWFVRPLGDGVVWKHYLFENLFGGKQSVSYIEVNRSKAGVSVEFPYLATTRGKTSSMISTQFSAAVAGCNGTYFETTGTGGHRTYLRVNNTVIPPGGELFSPWGYEGAIAMDASDVMTIIQRPSGGWANNTTHPDIMACGPLLIIDTVIPSAYFTTIGSHCTSRHPRTAVGTTTDNRLILLTVDGRTEMANGMTCDELAQVMAQLGCTNALNLDGGGSTTLWGKGEPYSGVLNYPSDNSLYDHLGERSCSNAIAIIAPPPPATLAWDARLTGKTVSTFMERGKTQTATLAFLNCGNQTWTAADTTLVLARPATRSSELHDAATWVSPAQPALMSPPTVPPGATATFSFTLQAPEVETTTVYDEHFMLTQSGIGRFGPADSECWMRIIVEPPPSGGASFIVESRAGGQNFAWYSDSGYADSPTHCTATGCTGTIGMRYGSTYRTVAGLKAATVAPNFPGAGYYKVYVAWGAGSNRRSPITYIVKHAAGENEFQLDQNAIANTWVQLGTQPFYFNAGFGGTVVQTNRDIDVSGSMYAGGVKFELIRTDISGCIIH